MDLLFPRPISLKTRPLVFSASTLEKVVGKSDEWGSQRTVWGVRANFIRAAKRKGKKSKRGTPHRTRGGIITDYYSTVATETANGNGTSGGGSNEGRRRRLERSDADDGDEECSQDGGTQSRGHTREGDTGGGAGGGTGVNDAEDSSGRRQC